MTDNLRASLLMVLTMAGFSVEDSFIKLASGTVPPGQILLVLGIGGTLIMALAVRLAGVPFFDRKLFTAPFIYRSACEGGAMLTGLAALALLPLSLVSAMLQAAPILTTIGAAFVLGEKVGWRRWSAVLVGLGGVLLILRPGSAAFEPAMVLALLSIVFVSIRDVATRRLPPALPTVVVNFWGYASTIPAGLLLAWLDLAPSVWPDARAWAYLLGASIFGLVFYFTLTLALRMGEASVVVPFRYSRIVFALGLGMAIFGERPDAPVLAGMALVVLSGVYTIVREARVRRAPIRRRASPDPVAPL